MFFVYILVTIFLSLKVQQFYLQTLHISSRYPGWLIGYSGLSRLFAALKHTKPKLKYCTQVNLNIGRAIAQAVSRWLPTAAARVRTRSSKVGFVVAKLTLGQVFSEYLGFPCQPSFHQILHHHNHPGAGTIGHSVADVPSEPSLDSTPHYANFKKKKNPKCS
jgi:hypothetical protein